MGSALVIGMVVVALLVGACAGGVATGAPEPSAPQSETPTGSSPVIVTPTPSASPSGALAYDAVDEQIRAGTYATREFRFPFTAEIDTDLGIRDAADTSRLVYIGQDKNAPQNGDEEFSAMLLERVLDPDDQRTLEAMEDDVFEWFGRHPRLTSVPGSDNAFEVDGNPAMQVDLLLADPVQCGSFHADKECVLIGYGPEGDEPYALFAGSRVRIVVVDHDGTPILFGYQATDDERFPIKSGVFDRWVASVDFSE
jgi:hypothetical protein